MSDEESFLQRWSRRKQANRSAAQERPPSEPRDAGRGHAEEVAGAAAEAIPPRAELSPLDPQCLPPIDTIGRATDIRPFLAAGVPEEMTRAALRRAWSADPAIRDFVGLSENFWDAASGGNIPGFGSLTLSEARDLLARLTGSSEAPDRPQQDHPATVQGSEDATLKAVDGS